VTGFVHFTIILTNTQNSLFLRSFAIVAICTYLRS
jgi:hypothetical protein